MAAKDNVSEQFIDVFHRSRDATPPHEVSGEDYFYNEFEDRPYRDLRHFEKINPEGDLIFTGTRQAANALSDNNARPYLHKYRIPASMVRPETFADDMAPPNSTPARPWGKFNEKTKQWDDGPQYELWETTPAQTHLVTPNSVVRYRNNVEDYGNLSHIIHKQAVRSGKIQYVGMEEDDEHPESWD